MLIRLYDNHIRTFVVALAVLQKLGVVTFKDLMEQGQSERAKALRNVDRFTVAYDNLRPEVWKHWVFLRDIESELLDQLGKKASNKGDVELLDTIVELLGTPFSSRFDTTTMEKLRRAILSPEDAQELREHINNTELRCAGCLQIIPTGALVTFIKTMGGVCFKCTSCSTPIVMSCTKCHTTEMPIPKTLKTGIQRVHTKCPTCKQQGVAPQEQIEHTPDTQPAPWPTPIQYEHEGIEPFAVAQRTPPNNWAGITRIEAPPNWARHTVRMDPPTNTMNPITDAERLFHVLANYPATNPVFIETLPGEDRGIHDEPDNEDPF